MNCLLVFHDLCGQGHEGCGSPFLRRVFGARFPLHESGFGCRSGLGDVPSSSPFLLLHSLSAFANSRSFESPSGLPPSSDRESEREREREITPELFGRSRKFDKTPSGDLWINPGDVIITF